MPEKIRDLFKKDMIKNLAAQIKKHYKSFDEQKFVNEVFDERWEDEAFKDRIRHITYALDDNIDLPFSETLKIFKSIVNEVDGIIVFVFADYVEVHGLDNYDESIGALELFTQYSSSEFEVRPFLMKYPDKMIKQMFEWSKHPNEYVRRLASEGCRPRLPWHLDLPQFKKDPSPIIPILENLKNDESEYVRKSVANNLNDISKDNPDVVLDIVNKWIGKDKNTDKLLKHACRTLLKQGNREALSYFNIRKGINIEIKNFKLDTDIIKIGSSTDFSFDVVLNEPEEETVRLEYEIDFMKGTGKPSSKIFHISELYLMPGSEKPFRRKLSFEDLTIRKHYPGKHKLTIIVNGEKKASLDFDLVQ